MTRINVSVISERRLLWNVTSVPLWFATNTLRECYTHKKKTFENKRGTFRTATIMAGNSASRIWVPFWERSERKSTSDLEETSERVSFSTIDPSVAKAAWSSFSLLRSYSQPCTPSRILNIQSTPHSFIKSYCYYSLLSSIIWRLCTNSVGWSKEYRQVMQKR